MGRHGVCISHLKIKTNSLHPTVIFLTSAMILPARSLKPNYSSIAVFTSSPLICSSSQSNGSWVPTQQLKLPNCPIQKLPLCSTSQQPLIQVLTYYFIKHSCLGFYDNRLSLFFFRCLVSLSQCPLLALPQLHYIKSLRSKVSSLHYPFSLSPPTPVIIGFNNRKL